MKIYLAHPYRLRNVIREFDLFLRDNFPQWKIVNPFYDLNRGDINERCDRGELTQMQYGDIVRMDRKALSECDSMIAVIMGNCIGTTFEVWDKFCTDLGDIYIITEPENKNHPWLNYISQVSGIPLFHGIVDFYRYADKHMRK